jgi:hypothetical protein
MRAYALLLGTLFTVGSICIAELAVESSGVDRAPRLARQASDAAALGATWYGGTLRPITVETRDATRAAVAVAGRTRRGQARSAPRTAQLAVPLHPGRVGPTDE